MTLIVSSTGCPSECPNECDTTTSQCYCDNCDNPATCNPITKACAQCNSEGWQTPFCTKPCIRNCLTCTESSPNTCGSCKAGYAAYTDANNNEGCCSEGCNQVNGEYACDVATGECNNGCTSGKFGTECNQDCGTSIPNCFRCFQSGTNPVTCSACLSGFQYNATTNRCCRDLCGGQCPITNCDACDENFLQGVFCTQCSSNYFEQENDEQCCKENCLKCANGDCEICVDGYYPSGDLCLPCSDLCESPGCSSTSGSCTADCVDTTNYNWLWPDFYCCSINCVNNNCSASGDCLSSCLAEFYGPRCDDPCPADCAGGLCARDTGNCLTGCNNDKYGQKCENDCTCQKGDCNWKTGECLCDKNFWGVNCEFSCSPSCEQEECLQDNGNCLNGECKLGFYGNQCEFTCNNCTDTNCNDATGVCISGCKPGYHGDKCNGLCRDIYTNCAVCDRVSPTTCTECVNNFYGADCSAQCNDNCKANSINGITTCRQSDGYCDDGCDPFSWGNQCQNTCPFCADELCDRSSGLCLCDQSKGSCGARDLCARGRFGADCNSNCSLLCKPETDSTIRCDVTNGRCLNGCPDGRWGNECTSLCASGCGGQSNACNQTNGYCLEDKCDPEFFGVQCRNDCNSQCVDKTCDRVEGTCGDCKDPQTVNCPTENCKRGKWGLTCEQDCPSNCLYELCNRTTGECRGCKKGFYGNECTSNCTNCLDIGIEALCVQDTAVCVSGCIPGYWKLTCTESCDADCATCDRDTSACTTCRPSRHGILCDQDCNNGCTLSSDGNRYCDKLDGSCIPAGVCVDGFWGVSCRDSCNENCAKENGVLRCRNTDGTCTSGCEPTWFGNTCIDRCSTRCKNRLCSGVADNCLQGCADGFYGSNRCNSVCSSNCANTGCDPITGECDDQGCRTGFWDLRCDKPCIYPCLDTTCNRETGSCLDCGLEIPGPQCPNISCPIGYFTSTCNVVCPTANCKGGVCDRKSGNCSTWCKDGFFGETCSENCQCRSPGTKACLQAGACQCNAGYYGPNCEFECSEGCMGTTCDADTGECTCRSGRYGSRCELICDKCTNEICNADNGNCNEGCKANHWGLQCTADCPSNCETCTQLEGQCKTCVGAFHGAVCESRCSSNCIAVNNIRTCEKSNGRCSAGCEDSWFGSQCDEQCLTCASDSCNREGVCTLGCKAGQWGSLCDRECSTNCVKPSGISICDRDTGKCDDGCVAGWLGPECDQQCNALCKGQMCTGTSDNCDDGCIDGRYGAGCSHVCSTNCLNGLCSNIGVCSDGCEKTFYGGKCNDSCRELCTDETCNQDTGYCEDCATGNKGPLCPGICSTKPDFCHNNGKCIDEGSSTSCICDTGYTGDRCDTPIDDGVNIPGGIIGGVAGGLVAAVATSVLVFCAVKHRRRSAESPKSSSTAEIGQFPNPSYETNAGNDNSELNMHYYETIPADLSLDDHEAGGTMSERYVSVEEVEENAQSPYQSGSGYIHPVSLQRYTSPATQQQTEEQLKSSPSREVDPYLKPTRCASVLPSRQPQQKHYNMEIIAEIFEAHSNTSTNIGSQNPEYINQGLKLDHNYTSLQLQADDSQKSQYDALKHF